MTMNNINLHSASAIAHPNIAFIKYWGNADPYWRIPVNGSISMNLDGLFTKTTVTFVENFVEDKFYLNGELQSAENTRRVSAFLDNVRKLANINLSALIESENNFPTAAGIASSASAFAALALASTTAMQINLDEKALSRLARFGSGSASRSIPSGYVEWQAGTNDEDSFAFSIAPPEHWALCDCIAIVSTKSKVIGSTQGHELATTSPLQTSRVLDAPRRLDLCRQAILSRDFEALSSVVEIDCIWMHAVMMTSSPPLMYWSPATLEIMLAIQEWRKQGLPVCFTVDAGSNVHAITESQYAVDIVTCLRQIPSVLDVITAKCGKGAEIISKIP